jgi:hypothetical protein
MKIILNLFIVFFLNYCSSSEFKLNPIPQSIDPFWDDLAEFIACVPMKEGNQFSELTARSTYRQYTKQMNQYWDKIQTNYLEKVEPWKQENITNLSPYNTTLYPLAGGDFINLYTFNSSSPRYVMIGLQKPGYIRDPRNFSDAELGRALGSIQSVVGELAVFNYSTSKRLQREVANPYFTGIAPTLIFFMKRFGFSILDLERIYLNEIGVVSKEEESFEISDKRKTTGVRIRFYKKEEGFVRELFFFRIWLSGKSATSDTAEGKFIQSLGRMNLMFKSAEYIFHTPEYKDFLSTLVSRSDRVVEDESGVPLRFFNGEEWNMKVYGKYLGKIPLKNTPVVPFQSDLDELFRAQSQPLPFDFGYGVLKGKGKSNLLLFERKSLQSKAQH